MSARRRSPMLQCLPRRELGLNGLKSRAVVKLRTTYHGGAKRAGRTDRFDQLTVPSDIAEQLPPDCKFRVVFDGARIVYERLDVMP